MSDSSESTPPEWDLDTWKAALSIDVGAAYACHKCGNLVMVTRGGVGVMELRCCGGLMEKIERCAEGEGDA